MFGFLKRLTPARQTPATPTCAGIDLNEVAPALVDEAVTELGLLVPSSREQLQWMLADCMAGHHPKAVGTSFRKSGTQLDRDAKRAMGLRANVSMSQEALALMTEAGRQRPLDAIETTLLRAALSMLRYRAVASARAHGHDTFTASGAFKDCPGCSRFCHGSERLYSGDEILSLIPPSDCAREACAVSVQLRIDFIGQLVRSENEKRLK